MDFGVLTERTLWPLQQEPDAAPTKSQTHSVRAVWEKCIASRTLDWIALLLSKSFLSIPLMTHFCTF